MILNPKKRRRKAFNTAFLVAFSYLKLTLLKKVISTTSFEKRLNKLHLKNGLRIKNTILELNGLFIKIGQLLSILSKIIPKEFGEILESLQDKTPYSDFDKIKTIIETELNAPMESLFIEFETTPLASASIGQVHKAELPSGEIVAVKIQHPYIKELAEVDLNIVEKILKQVIRIFKIKGIDHAFEQVKLMIKEELDYAQEASSMQIIKAHCKDIEDVYIPEVFSSLSTKIILTTKFCEGVKITNSQKMKEWNLDRNKIANNLVFTYCEMLLNHGIYHADPHPGNLMIDKKGKLIILDFGAVGELKEEMRTSLPDFIQALIAEDEEKVMKNLQKMGFISKGKENNQATKKIISALTEFIQEAINSESLDFKNIKDSSLFELQKELSIKELTTSLNVPKDWILLERTLILLYGICTNIAPDYKAMETIKPYLKKLALKDGGLKKIIIDSIKLQVLTLFSLPKKIDTYLSKANKGEMEYKIKNFDSAIEKIVKSKNLFTTSFCFVGFLLGAMTANIYELPNYESVFIALTSIFGVLFIFKSFKKVKP